MVFFFLFTLVTKLKNIVALLLGLLECSTTSELKKLLSETAGVSQNVQTKPKPKPNKVHLMPQIIKYFQCLDLKKNF